jgi:ribosome biogenesis protein ALB1
VTTIKNSSGSTAIVSLSSSTGGGVLVNTVISKKKAKKVERNMKYAAARARVSATGKEKKKLDAEMRVDEEVADKENVYRAALWNLVENVKVNGVPLTGVAGQGTTLGSPLF